MKYYTHKFPQNVWASEIVKLIKEFVSHDKYTLFDAPCGNGIVGALVKTSLHGPDLTLLDYDKRLEDSAYARLVPGTRVVTGDIFSYRVEGDENVWLLINSLYCLPDSENLILGKKNSMKFIIGIFPDIHAVNYKYFRKKNPSFENPSAMDIESTIRLFNKCGYQMIKRKGITRLPFHKLNTIADKLHIIPQIRNVIFTLLNNLLFFLPPQYSIIAFRRNE